MTISAILLIGGFVFLISHKVFNICMGKEARTAFNLFYISIFYISLCSRIKDIIIEDYELNMKWFWSICFLGALFIGILLKVKGIDEDFQQSRE